MHALFVVSKIDANRLDEAEAALTNGIRPMLEQAPGFIKATFSRSADGTQGRSMALFQSEAEARDLIEKAMAAIPADGPIKILEHHVFGVTMQVGAS
jgi:hypothetical protein